jgi:multisubunit Na+/H+ antiporter MnhG subunit
MWIIIGGIVAIILGVLGLIEWWLLFLKALAALIPFILVVGGVLAVIVGITSRKEKIEEEKEEVIEQSSESDKS